MDLVIAKDLVKKYRISVATILGGFILLGLLAPLLIKPKFKVTSVLSISPSYFQNSLMREFLSEVYDGAELRSQRQSLIAQALNQRSLDEISKKAGLMPETETPVEASIRRQALLKSVEIFPVQSSDYQISVVSNNPQRSLLINQEVLTNVQKTLRSKRLRTLENLRTAIGVQLDSMMPNSVTSTALQMKITQMQQELELKRASFASKHPVLMAQEKELQKLQAMYEAAKLKPSEATTAAASKPYKTLSAAPEHTVYNDLSRKYAYLNIVILAEADPNPSYFSIVRSPELPSAPIWPKKSLFLIWSLLLGVLTAAVYVAMKELVFGQRILGPVVPVTVPSRYKARVSQGSLKNHEFVEPHDTQL